SQALTLQQTILLDHPPSQPPQARGRHQRGDGEQCEQASRIVWLLVEQSLFSPLDVKAVYRNCQNFAKTPWLLGPFTIHRKFCFDKDNWPDMANQGWGSQIYRHYGVQPYWQEAEETRS